MIHKKKYITPNAFFDSIEEEDGLCLASVIADDKPGEGWGGDYAKRADFCLDDEFIGPIEAANNNFEYSMEFDY